MTVLSTFSLPAFTRAQASPKPMSKEAIIKLLKGHVPPKRVETLARERGIDFPITSETETELRTVGATDSLLATLCELAPKPPLETPRRAMSTPTAGTVKENPKDGLKYVWIPPGSFQMGCSSGDNECSDDEKPSHRVTLSKGFWIGQTGVTVSAYKRFAAGAGRQMPSAPSFNRDWANDKMPIVNMNWDDAHAYCEWAGGRLPTEAEREYAARGGSTEARYGPVEEVAWYGANSGNQTHRVGEKRANGFGLFDMLGNAWEWVNDWYDARYYSGSPATDPSGPSSSQYRLRVLRGGSWGNFPGGVRVSGRYRGGPDYRNVGAGVRCVQEVE